MLGGSEAVTPPATIPPIREPTGERSAEPAPAQRIDRRRFLVRLGGATALVTVSGGVVGRLLGPDQRAARAARAGGQAPRPWSATHPLPNADAAVRPVPGTRAELTPVPDHYRIDINTRSPRVDADSWRLSVDGLVERPLALTLDELRGRDPVHQFVTLECISNRIGGDLISTTRWTGVSLQRLLPELGLRSDATHLVIRSVDGFFECLPLSVPQSDPRVMLCYEWDGLPLPVEHGYPLRIWVPDHFGMKQPKWIESITATDAWEPGYWVVRGWDKEARVRTTSVIDVIAVDEAATAADGRKTIPVGGIAYAGARGISRVQLRTDGGAWRDAEIRRPLADTTWALWRWEWPFAPGDHRIEVRCFDGDGRPQVEQPSPPHPDGATGLDGRELRIQ
jgi:DMSO/TMAO reductase YedYZ molybdopterin-dependent catalytic subunit